MYEKASNVLCECVWHIYVSSPTGPPSSSPSSAEFEVGNFETTGEFTIRWDAVAQGPVSGYRIAVDNTMGLTCSLPADVNVSTVEFTCGTNEMALGERFTFTVSALCGPEQSGPASDDFPILLQGKFRQSKTSSY